MKIQINIPEGYPEVRLFQLPDNNLAWLHLFDANGKEDVEKQIELDPGNYKIVDFKNGIVTLETNKQ